MFVQGAHQLLLRVRIAEVQRNALQELGVQTNIGNNQDRGNLDFVFAAAQAIGQTASP
jgi:Flp pilus assembly secretin CpaC